MPIFSKTLSPVEHCQYPSDSKFAKSRLLYKYRDWKNPDHQRILRENRIYSASPASFEDYKDCSGPEDFPKGVELFKLFWKLSYLMGINTNIVSRIKWLLHMYRTSPLANPSLLPECIRYNKEYFNARVGILSLTANAHSHVMWEKYGANNKGVCFGLDKKKLFSVFNSGGPIVYTDTLPVIHYFMDSGKVQHIKRVFYKERKWSFEEEYRFCKILASSNLQSVEWRNILMPEGTIREIIFGKDMDPSDKEEIRNLAKRYQPDARIKDLSVSSKFRRARKF